MYVPIEAKADLTFLFLSTKHAWHVHYSARVQVIDVDCMGLVAFSVCLCLNLCIVTTSLLWLAHDTPIPNHAPYRCIGTNTVLQL